MNFPEQKKRPVTIWPCEFSGMPEVYAGMLMKSYQFSRTGQAAETEKRLWLLPQVHGNQTVSFTADRAVTWGNPRAARLGSIAADYLARVGPAFVFAVFARFGA